MTWCARCDVLTTEAAGEACPSCGEPILDPVSPRRKGSGVQILEADVPPAVGVQTHPAPSLPEPVVPGTTLRFTRRVIVGAVVVAMAGTAVGLAIRDGRSLSNPSTGPSVTATTRSATAWVPPFGEGVSGWVIFPSQRGFTRLELASGFTESVDLHGDAFGHTAAPTSRRIAYLDPGRVLMVTNQAGDLPTAITSEVDSFSWTSSGDAIIVARSQSTTRGEARSRIELISIEDRSSLLLIETTSSVHSISSHAGRHFATLFENDEPHLYEIGPATKRLLRKGVLLLDVSPDGTTAIVATRGKPSVLAVDVDTRKATRIGPKDFLAQIAVYSPDGKRAAIVGTPHFSMEPGGCDDASEIPLSECPPFPVPRDQILWILETATGAMRSIHAWTPDELLPPTWGPDGWILVSQQGRASAIPIDDPASAAVSFTGDFDQAWGQPQYLS